ncbi:histidine phosphatase superfamily [Kickxella alabastrina]|uniref:histidine phosphatase superfamily n=1 Tax=Kickxella alabastrina TaxID=61397 RepID=UPI00221E8880|nr:histidine phosphatase superfamily [Kickxella alabastrina]KAI7820601.1 histidine phosphatase superfamily [Kickxella alabastrina]
MPPIDLPLDTLTCYFVRHGERTDHVDDTWAATSSAPHDPPLTPQGRLQAEKTGALIYELETSHINGLSPDTASNTDYLVLTSPFLRCAQTSEGLCSGFQQRHQKPTSWKISVEPGLSEVMREGYFDQQVPDSLIHSCISSIQNGKACTNMPYSGAYVAASSVMPAYPEGFQDMMARFVSTLDHAVSWQIGQVTKAKVLGRETRRVVLVFVTHGAGISSLLWATTLQLGSNDVDYCCLTRAHIVNRKNMLPLPKFGTSRAPAFSWSVSHRAYAKHLANL